MKNIILFLLVVILSNGTFSQTMTVHKNDQTTINLQLSQIDSITFSLQSIYPPITLSGRLITGLAFNSGFLWAIHQPSVGNNTFRISKIDPSSRQVLLESGNIGDNGRGITVGAGALWVTKATADIISKLDTSTFAELASFSTPGSEPNGIAFDGTNLWLTDPFFQKIYQLNTSGSVVTNFNIPNAFRNGLEWENGGMWTNTDTNKVSFYTTIGTITSTRTVGVLSGNRYIYDIAIGGGKVFISNGEKIDIQNWP